MTFATQDLTMQPGVLQTPKRGHDTAQKSCSTFLPTPISEKSSRDVLSVLDPNKFSWLSPASTISTTSSPAGFNDMWDPPETPTKRTVNASLRGILTPVTPPTPPDFPKKLLLTPISKPFFGVGVTPAIQQPLFQEKGTAAQDDPSEPKLFRGVTLVLEEISKASVAAATVKYNSDPTFVFTQDTSVSLRTRSKTASTTPVASFPRTAIREETSIVTPPQGRIHPLLHSKFAKLLEQLIPHDLHARLASAPGCCAASLVTSPSTRCSSAAKPKGSRNDAISAVKNVSKCNRQEDYCSMLRNIETVVQSVMCIRHQHTALTQLKAGSRISQLRSKLEGTTRMTALDQSTLTQWVNTISDLDASMDHAARPIIIETKSKPPPQLKRELKPMFKLPTVETKARFSPSSGFRTYEPTKTRGLSVFSALHEKAASPLGTKDLTPGYVYLFWDKAFFGMVKIGHTKDLAKRLKSWNTKCKHQHDYHSSAESQVEMPYVHRVEQLIHTELKGCRLRRQCEGCGKLHKEWFEASQAHVVKVMKKWREWILQEPYVQDKESREWVLKPEILASLEQMCEPLPQDVATQKSQRKSGGMQRNSRKRKSPRRTM
ncbi:T5orf172 domain-containing protein [Alternaria rosae]|uniref:T5orf172 domain-containing protein n=1 Tax=Alternaria rosae TaxID=1187941 RepID=UPI001E8D8896|nr:T5orf172 domain-containing protein [Alternaria rosae]KAH6878478.1 T5orf172 domain-containing protein [Alternaria rosae]